jgi:hypothetical protein
MIKTVETNCPEKIDQESNRGNPVNIVVTKHTDPLIVFESRYQPFDGAVHPQEEERIVNFSQGR